MSNLFFGVKASTWVYDIAKMFANYSNATPHTQRSAEDAFMRYYGINPTAVTANDEINVRPKLIKSLMKLSLEYSNILRYDPDSVKKYQSFVLYERNCFTEHGMQMKITGKTLMYVNAVLERNHIDLGVGDDGYPVVSNVYDNLFYDYFNLFYRFVTLTLVENEQILPNKQIVKKCQDNNLKIDGVHIIKAKDIPFILGTSDILSRKARLFCY